MNLNDERTSLGTAAIERFAALTNGDLNCDPETVLFDLLMSLRHYARDRAIDFNSSNERAAEFYELSLVAPDGAVSELPLPH